MSDKTLFNQDLVLNKLTVNNSIDANASGYVAESTIINAGGLQNNTIATNELTLTNATAPDATLTNVNGTVYTPNSVNVDGTITTNASVAIGNTLILKNGPTSPNDVVLSCPQNNVLNVAGSTITTNVSLLSSTGNVNLTAPSGNTLLVGGNVQATGAVTSANLTLVSGVNSTTLTQSSTDDNTLVVTGDLQVGNSITLPQNAFAFVSSPVFTGGLISCVYTPAVPVVCGPGLYTAINCNIQNVPTNININTCAFFFQLQCINALGGCVPVCVPAYTATRSGTTISLGIAVSNAPGASGATVNNVSIFIVNPSYGANAP
jgi:hypothetical protein